MKKLHLTIFTMLLMLFSITFSQAQQPDRQKTLNFLLKTNRLIGHAHMSVKRGKVYSGDLSKAVRHERLAKQLFQNGNYKGALAHSRRARILATESIKANKVKPTSDATFTPEENTLVGTPTSDEELDKELNTQGIAEITDETIINQNNLELEVK